MKDLQTLTKKLVELLLEVGSWQKKRLKKDLRRERVDIKLLRAQYDDLLSGENDLAQDMKKFHEDVFRQNNNPPTIGSDAWWSEIKEHSSAYAISLEKSQKKVRGLAEDFEETRQECFHTFHSLEIDIERLEKLRDNIQNIFDRFEAERKKQDAFPHVRLLLKQLNVILPILREEVVNNEALVKYDQLPSENTIVFDTINRLQVFRMPETDDKFNLYKKVREEMGITSSAQKEVRKARPRTTFSLDGLSIHGEDLYVVLDSSFFIHFTTFINNKDLCEFYKAPDGFENARIVFVPFVVGEVKGHAKHVLNRMRKGMNIKEVAVDINDKLRDKILSTYRQTTKGMKSIAELGEKEALESFLRDADFQIIGFAMQHKSVVIGDDRDLEEMLNHVHGTAYHRCASMTVYETFDNP